MKSSTLIVYMHGIGDHLMATEAIHEFKQQHPNTDIYLLTLRNPCFVDLWKNNKDVKEVLFSSLHKNPRYGSPLFWAGDHWRIRKDIKRLKKKYNFSQVYFIVHFFMSGKIYPYLPFKKYSKHKSTIVAEQLGVRSKKKGYYFSLSTKEKAFAKNFFLKYKLTKKKVVGFHYTASTKNKSLSKKEVGIVLEGLISQGYHVLILSDKDVSASFKGFKGVTTFCSDKILITAALLERCKGYVGVDSGIAHLAAAVKRKCLVLFMKNLWIKNSAVLGKGVHMYDYSHRTVSGLKKAVRNFSLLLK